MTALRRTLAAFAVTAVIVVAAFAGAAAFSHDHGSGSSEHALRDFLTDAVVDRDGMDACAYASSRSLQRLLSADPRGMSCVTAVAVYAHLTLGGEPVDTEAAVKALSYRAKRQADGAEQVTVSARGDSRAFVLRRATQRELTEFDAPSTPWRIATGFVELMRGGRRTRSKTIKCTAAGGPSSAGAVRVPPTRRRSTSDAACRARPRR